MERQPRTVLVRRAVAEFGGVCQLAKELGSSPSSIYHWMRGERMNMATQVKLEMLLDKSLSGDSEPQIDEAIGGLLQSGQHNGPSVGLACVIGLRDLVHEIRKLRKTLQLQ